MADQFQIASFMNSADHRVLKLSGALLLTTVFQFQSLVREDTTSNLLVDLSEVPYVDSAGIGALVNAHISHTKNGRSFALSGVNDRVMTVLKITKVDTLFTLVPPDAAAAATVL